MVRWEEEEEEEGEWVVRWVGRVRMGGGGEGGESSKNPVAML